MTNSTSGRDWWRLSLWPLLGISFGVAFWVSFMQQRQLGFDVGWDSPWGLPVILDVLYVATLIDYMRRPRTFNRVASILLVVITSIGNALALLYDPTSTHLPAPLPVAMAWKVLPPLAMFVIAHYIANARKETGRWIPTSQPSDNQSVSRRIRRGTGPASGPAVSGSATRNGSKSIRSGGRARTASAPAKTKQTAAQRLADQLIADGSAEWAQEKIATQYSVSKTTAKNARDLAQHRLWVVYGDQSQTTLSTLSTNGLPN
jgi:hypothetical protein